MKLTKVNQACIFNTKISIAYNLIKMEFYLNFKTNIFKKNK